MMKEILIILMLGLIQLWAQDNPHGDIDFACETCHNSADWNTIQAYKFNHDQTSFELKGAHKNVDCLSCHESLIFVTAQTQCAACHLDIHKNELGARCEKCHGEQQWTDYFRFEEMHNMTNFPLIGVHANIDCESCHYIEQQNQFANVSVECSGCHLQDYMATMNPQHQKSGYDLNCQNCHLIVGIDWKAQNFPHPASFPLTGGHGGLQCVACHQGDQYSGLSTDCYSCHAADYTATNNPNHISAQFPVTCEDCHTIKGWGSANWDHDRLFFPIYSGEHRGEWNNCSDCHVNTGNYTHFECINCHEHRQSKMDSEHDDERNYVYQSQACYDCHPRGEGDD